MVNPFKNSPRGPSRWLVSFMRRGMEPPHPFGKTKQEVVASSREEAISLVPYSHGFPITARRLPEPAGPMCDYCGKLPVAETVTSGGKPMALCAPHAAELNRGLRGLPNPLAVCTNAGDCREVFHGWQDGSVECPYCGYAIRQGVTRDGALRCENPGCDAFPGMTAEMIQERRGAHAARVAEEARRTHDNEWAMKRIDEDNRARAAAQQAAVAEARARGACLNRACLFPRGTYGPSKFVRHRGVCPKERR